MQLSFLMFFFFRKDVNIRLLRGGSKQSQDLKQEILKGECQVVVGTHALLQPNGNLYF